MNRFISHLLTTKVMDKALVMGAALAIAFVAPTSHAADPRMIVVNKGFDAKAFKKPSAEELKKKLTPLQFDVTQKEGTEPPFHNDYFENHADGIYVDIVSGEPLFSSVDKYESGTGWPSFTKPLKTDFLIEKTDKSLGVERTEVKSRYANSHLGHVFTDGPKDRGGLRYCMNSASLKFIPVDKLDTEGYGEYAKLFSKKPAAKK